MRIRFVRIWKRSRKPRLILRQQPACRTPDAGPDLLQNVQRHVEAKTVEQLDSAQVMLLERNLESLLREARVRKTELMIEAVTNLHQQEMRLPPENLLMENEVPMNNNLSAMTNQQNRNQNQELDAIPNPNHHQQLLLMGMHLNNNNNNNGGSGAAGGSSISPIHQLQHHQQNHLFLMGMHLNNNINNNPPATNDNNDGGGGGDGSGPSPSSVLQRDAFQKGILHFF